MVEDADVDRLLASVAAGSETAWSQLWAAVEPRLFGLVRTYRVSGPLSTNVDECRDIVVEVMARLRDSEVRRSKMFLDARDKNPGLSFFPWLFVVARRVAIDYQRGHGDYIDRRRSRNPGSAPGRWVQHQTLPGDSRLGGL